jgi:CRP-like cAMP-binding protein
MERLPKRTLDFRLFRHLGARERRFAPGEVIVAENSSGDVMYVVRTGTAEVRANGKLVEKVGPGGIFGEMALIDRSTRSASVIARDEVVVVPIDERRFVLLVAKAPHFALNRHAHPGKTHSHSQPAPGRRAA